MSDSREWACQIHESVHVRFMKLIIKFFYNFKFIKITMKNSREWSCQIHENGHVKFMRVVMSNS